MSTGITCFQNYLHQDPPPRGCAGGRIDTRYLRRRGTSPLKGANPRVQKWELLRLEGASVGCAGCINSQQTRPSDETQIKPRSRVKRLSPSSHVKEPSVTAHYEHFAHDEWSIVDMLHWLNLPSLPITFPYFESRDVYFLFLFFLIFLSIPRFNYILIYCKHVLVLNIAAKIARWTLNITQSINQPFNRYTYMRILHNKKNVEAFWGKKTKGPKQDSLNSIIFQPMLINANRRSLADSKGVIRSHKLKKNRQHNGQKFEDTKEVIRSIKQRSTKHYMKIKRAA